MRCSIRIGEPIDIARYADRDADHMVLREITDELMFEIRELTGQQYRNTYATKGGDVVSGQVENGESPVAVSP